MESRRRVQSLPGTQILGARTNLRSELARHVCSAGLLLPMQLLDIDAVMERTGNGRTKHYEDIQLGMLPQPIRRGARFSRWPSEEIDAVVRARIAGFHDGAIRSLVQQLVAARTATLPACPPLGR